jgi:hypothetical protein
MQCYPIRVMKPSALPILFNDRIVTIFRGRDASLLYGDRSGYYSMVTIASGDIGAPARISWVDVFREVDSA